MRGLLAGIAADADTMTEVEVFYDTPEWVALCEWLELHGVDPQSVLGGTRVSRDECNRCIRFVAIVRDEAGRVVMDEWLQVCTTPAVEQGEAILPYPELIASALRPAVRA